MPDAAIHRITEKLLFDTAKDHGDKVNVAIVCPPDIYGPGKGLAKTWSALVPLFIDQAKKLDDGAGRTFYYNEGTNARSWVHIDDLMRVYVKLVEAAIKGGEGAEWGEKVFHYPQAGNRTVSDIARATTLPAPKKSIRKRWLLPLGHSSRSTTSSPTRSRSKSR